MQRRHPKVGQAAEHLADHGDPVLGHPLQPADDDAAYHREQRARQPRSQQPYLDHDGDDDESHQERCHRHRPEVATDAKQRADGSVAGRGQAKHLPEPADRNLVTHADE